MSVLDFIPGLLTTSNHWAISFWCLFLSPSLSFCIFSASVDAPAKDHSVSWSSCCHFSSHWTTSLRGISGNSSVLRIVFTALSFAETTSSCYQRLHPLPPSQILRACLLHPLLQTAPMIFSYPVSEQFHAVQVTRSGPCVRQYCLRTLLTKTNSSNSASPSLRPLACASLAVLLECLSGTFDISTFSTRSYLSSNDSTTPFNHQW